MHLGRLTVLLGTPGASMPHAEAVEALVGNRTVLADKTADSWPFRRTVVPPGGPAAIVIQALHEAFPTGQAGSARLVTTQSTYQLQRWLDWLEANPASAMIGALTDPPPDVLRDASTRRGPWARVDVVEVAVDAASPSGNNHPLGYAFRQTDPAVRHAACRRALDESPTDAALGLALASACMETGRLDEAEAILGRAVSQVPDWEAGHFEVGKLWLRRDDTERAAAAFAEASRLMPSFAAAHANLGAALGELERPEEALVALERAASLNPFGHPIHNNVGASLRDLGRLTEAESSFRHAIGLDPTFVFGYYNLGHVLFLQGRFAQARDAYEDGLTRDPWRTPRQRLRLALTLAALDDEAPATTHARSALNDAPAERRAELLDEMAEVVKALVALHGEHRPGVRALEQVAADYRSSIPRN